MRVNLARRYFLKGYIFQRKRIKSLREFFFPYSHYGNKNSEFQNVEHSSFQINFDLKPTGRSKVNTILIRVEGQDVNVPEATFYQLPGGGLRAEVKGVSGQR